MKTNASPWHSYALINLFKKTKQLSLLLILIICFNSCKKDLILPISNKPPKSEFNVESVSYNNFINSINLNSLGFLKPKLNPVNRGKLLSINDNSLLGNLYIYTDSVKRIINKHDTSYVFQMALSSPKSIAFRNLTINTNNGKVSAFITTYTPNREWIEAWRVKKNIPFKGDISFAKFDLNGRNLYEGLSVNPTSSKAGKAMFTNNKVMKVQTVCTTYFMYMPIAYGCSYGGHMPWDSSCTWNGGGESNVPPEGHYAAGYTYVSELRVSCTDVYVSEPGAEGPTGGGGGGTSPNPPGGYDPCNTETPTVFNARVNDGLKLAVLPPSPCDEGGLPPVFPETPISLLNQSQRQQAILITNKALSFVLEDIPSEFFLNSEQSNLVSETLVDELEYEYYANINNFSNLISISNYEDPEHPFLTLLKNNIRRFLGIDQPKNQQEAEQVIALHQRIAKVSGDIIAIHNAQKQIFGFIPGYSALDALIVEQNYTSAALNASFDIFGGTILKGITGPIFRVAEKYSFKTIELSIKYPNIANALKSFSIREFNIIKRSNSNKIIIIGEDMTNRILPSTNTFNKIFKNTETFAGSNLAEQELNNLKQSLGRNLTSNELKSTLMYQENMNWIKNKLAQGYNVIDIGPKTPNQFKSPFYLMERSHIYTK